MLPLFRASRPDTRISSPGRSGSSTEKVKIRPRLIRPCWTREAMVITSMLPPERTETTFLPSISRCFRAATVSRPAFSTTILCFSITSRKASTSSASGMDRTRSTFFCT